MSTLKNLVHRLVMRSRSTSRPVRDMEHLSLRDWADLPMHHPRANDTSF